MDKMIGADMGKKEYYEFDADKNEIKPLSQKDKQKITAKVDKWAVTKQVISLVASGCASVVMSKYLRASMPESQTIFEKAVTGVGMYFLTGIVGSTVAKYAEQELEEWRETVVSVKEEIEDAR